MLCPSCRRQLERGASYCGSCGAPLNGAPAPLELVLDGGQRVPVVSELVIGRAPGSTVLLDDPSVSRTHARITADAVLEDAGSSHGTWLDGVRVTGPSPLRDGAKIRLGDAELRVERRREAAEAGRTMFVPAGATAFAPAVGTGGTQFGMRPRVRSGYALKRLDASEGRQRWVLKDTRNGTFLRLSDNDAWVFERLDGTHSLLELIALCEQRFGSTGSTRLVRLLTDLGERGFLSGVAGGQPIAEAPTSWWRKLIQPREKIFTGLGPTIEAIYRGGGWVFFTRPALIVLGVLGVLGLGAFIYLIAGRYGTPFVVASKIGWGGLVFLLGRFAVVGVHELAHGLTMASFGRRVDKAGLKAIAIFPYAFVDTSEAWFEPRRRRIAVSAAGPASDFSLGAVFALCALLLPEGTVRDIFFNLAFAAYVGAFFNLNPFIERDGYHILVDGLNEPGLRRRAKEQFDRRIRGEGRRENDSPVLARYALFGLGWSVVMALFAIAITFRYKDIFLDYAPASVVYGVMGTLWVAFFAPVFFVLGKPLWERFRGKK
ncbi:FHA domain-containing protein [Solirubrobacter sp. CPCC 204708]|uniref:FHA domain-containing protein n=1 Tax=Solirubrobacter deserti TaxID=2282478 RepID=A0ABT4RV67_9ACTN|nr:FHA domain-containing protein [Solirubrobacter deserti]MBE2319155.1 FHA domain-containing protein [Solirubrobacter deserti]MDA0142455.1 FHA domain-containing protein [Solirubrobacter deserti]